MNNMNKLIFNNKSQIDWGYSVNNKYRNALEGGISAKENITRQNVKADIVDIINNNDK